MDTTIIILSLIIALGAFSQGLTGFGLALVSVPLLSLTIDAKMAVPIAGIFGWLVTFPIAKHRWQLNRAIRDLLMLKSNTLHKCIILSVVILASIIADKLKAETYTIDAGSVGKKILPGGYHMGTAVNSRGQAIEANNYYLLKCETL